MNSIKNTTDDIIQIATAANEKYAHHLAVMISSVLSNTNVTPCINFTILDDGLSALSKQNIAHLRSIKPFNVNYLPVNLSEFRDFSVSGSCYISNTTYARFQLPDLLPNLDKCLYLDPDIVVRKDISELWEHDLQHYPLGAVEEPVGQRRNFDLNLPASNSYFNSGILVLDLAKLRFFNLTAKACAYMQKYPQLPYGDQDVFNVLFLDNWAVLPMKWNVTTSMYMTNNFIKPIKYSSMEFNAALKDPAIVHYTQQKKPDSMLCEHPFRNDYFKYLSMTPWSNLPLKDRNFHSYSLRFYWNIKSHIRKSPAVFLFLKNVKQVFNKTDRPLASGVTNINSQS